MVLVLIVGVFLLKAAVHDALEDKVVPVVRRRQQDLLGTLVGRKRDQVDV